MNQTIEQVIKRQNKINRDSSPKLLTPQGEAKGSTSSAKGGRRSIFRGALLEVPFAYLDGPPCRCGRSTPSTRTICLTPADSLLLPGGFAQVLYLFRFLICGLSL
jgi:hypothetical protein